MTHNTVRTHTPMPDSWDPFFSPRQAIRRSLSHMGVDEERFAREDEPELPFPIKHTGVGY